MRSAQLAVVLALPVLASALSLVARGQWEDRWSSGLRREFVRHGQRANTQVMNRYSLGTLCSDARTAARVPPCRTYNSFSATILGSGATAGVGLLLLGGIVAAGASARRSRTALVTGFRPVLYAATGVLVLLLLVHALLGMQVVRLVSLVAGLRPGGLFTFLAVAAFAAIFGASAAAVRMVRAARGTRRLLAVPLEEPTAAGWIGSLGNCPGPLSSSDGPAAGGPSAFGRSASGQPPSGQSPSGQLSSDPSAVVGLVPEVFVAPPATLCLDGRLPGASLHLPLTLAHILTGPQLHALVIRARARASAENAAAARLVETWSALTAEHESLRRTRGVRLALALPTLSVLALVLETYAEAEAALERQQQVAADRAAADTCGARTCGVAILKEAAFGPAWPAAVRQMREAVREGSQYPNARVLFAELVAANADTARVGAALHPDAATPPTGVLLRRRLELLGLVPEDLVAEALDVQPAEPAAALAGADLAPVEERLTSFVHLQLLQASHA